MNYLLIYVDDILIFIPKDLNSLAYIKKALLKEFEMKDMGELKSFLGIEVTWDQEKHMITLSQKGYIDAILEQFNYSDANPSWMPMVTQKMGGLIKGSNLNPRKEDYYSIVSSLIYLMIITRPNLANSVGIISRYLSNLSEEHLMVAKHILCYVKGIREHSLILGCSNVEETFNLYRYADANWGNDIDT